MEDFGKIFSDFITGNRKNVKNMTDEELREIIEKPLESGEELWWRARKELDLRL